MAASLEEALEALQKASGGAVVAQIPTVERQHPERLIEVPASVAAEEISNWYHLYEMRRPGSSAFQRRYGDPREEPGIEVEEARECFADLARLVEPFMPWPNDRTITTDRRDFYRSLSREQTTAMQESGLAFGELRPEQRELWMKINTRQAYLGVNTGFASAASAFSAWKRAGLGYHTRPVQQSGGVVAPRTSLAYVYPSPEEAGRLTAFSLSEPMGDPPRLDPFLAPAGEIHPARAGLPAAFTVTLELSGGPTVLRELVAELEKVTERQIDIPSYAGERRLFAYVSGATAQEVIGALEDLYGWRLRHQEARRYSLGRPRTPAGENHLDLHRKMRAALPPVGKRLLAETQTVTIPERYRRTVEELMADCTKYFGRGWDPVSPDKLSPRAQDLLSDLLFERMLLRAASSFLASENPQWWLIAPEQGYFTLEGDPAGKPLVQFHVRRPDGEIDAWGWFVGTSSFGN
jgi:hypothetical protein